MKFYTDDIHAVINKYFPVLESFDVYASLHQIIIIGSNDEHNIFKILKIARWTSDEKSLGYSDWFLSVSEDEYTYYYDDINVIKNTITSAMSAKLLVENALGIVGFVRFKQGYYMILITKRSQVAQLGQHKIYKVDETKMIYLPGNNISPWDNTPRTDSKFHFPQTKHPDEKRYLALFNSVDLSIDNYFSYTYDLSNTVQYNLSYFSGNDPYTSKVFQGIHEQQLLVNDRFVWNWSLWPPDLRPNIDRLMSGCSWLISLIHGYVGQSCISAGAGCVDIVVCLIARRSRHFAGTRFMKRGSNLNGNVANEVESEQIVYEDEGIEFEKSKVTSLVQLRGSIPLQWHQEITKSIRKPPIEMTAEDAYHAVSGRHFGNLIYRHGSPIIILNLVKQREMHKFEGPLSNKFVEAIDYLKSYFKYFQLEDEILKYIDFDMARIQRSKHKTVLVKMAPIADECIQKTGFFYSDALIKQLPERVLTKTPQCGLVRTNCIDCLDRTNTAQFVIGQAALGYQLYALGISNSTHIARLRSLDRMLQALYENHGNVLALQYGGSELVHNVETYRKTAKFSIHSRDFVQTISRYYNNKFSDHEKQMSINLFLGIFKPWQSPNESIWTHKNSDVFLHDKYCKSTLDHSQISASTWLSTDIIAFMPKPLVLWDKWQILNSLYKYASNSNLLAARKKRISNASFPQHQEFPGSNFERNYTHLFDLTSTNITKIFLFDQIYSPLENGFDDKDEEDGDSISQSCIFYNEIDKDEGMDSVETLTSGPVMSALRNASKSISSDSFSDISDEEMENSDYTKKIRPELLCAANCSILTSHGAEIDKNKYINFIITDYSHLSTNIGDCINSSSHFYLANDKFNITTMKVIGNYEPNSSYGYRSVNSNIYKETVNFNMTGKMRSSHTNFHKQYLRCIDFCYDSISKSS